MNTTGDPLLRAVETPDLNELIQEWQRARDDSGMEARLATAEDIRFTRWSGQSADGLKHQKLQPDGQRVSPWNKSFDTRQPLADDVINGLTDLLTVAFWQSRVRATPVTGGRMTAAQSAEMRQMITWLVHGALAEELPTEVELASQSAFTVGHSILYIGWREDWATVKQELTLEQIMAVTAAGQVPPEFLTALTDPALEDVAANVLQEFYPHLKLARSRRVVRELREAGKAEFPVRRRVRHLPEILALRPGEDVFVPPETSDLRNARAVFRRVYMTGQQIESEGAASGWSPDFIEKAKAAAESGSRRDNVSSYYGTAAWIGERLAEIIYAYTKANDEDGTAGIYCTVFSEDVADVAGTHYLVDWANGEYPFLSFSAEAASRRLMDSRGVPETFIATAQREYKAYRDAIANRTMLELKPPVIRTGSERAIEVDLGPDARLCEFVANGVRWLEPPKGNPQMAQAVMELLRDQVDDYFGRASERTPPSVTQTRQQRLVNRWLGLWSQVFRRALALVYQNYDPEELQSILGREPVLTPEFLDQNRLMVRFDVRSLDQDWVVEFMTAMANLILPADLAGVVDRAKYVRWMMAYFDPSLAEEITIEQEGAAQNIYLETMDEMVRMSQGNEALYSENDPTAGMRLQFMQQIVQANPKYQQQLQEDPRFQQVALNREKNLQQSVVQEENKKNGRLGVKPVGPGPA